MGQTAFADRIKAGIDSRTKVAQWTSPSRRHGEILKGAHDLAVVMKELVLLS